MSTSRSMDEEYTSKPWEESCVHIPDGLFYSQHEKNSNKGYLRLIPVSFENDVVGCDDYQSLVKVAQIVACDARRCEKTRSTSR